MKDPEKNKKKGHLDEDILEGKEDVLRAKDIIPVSPVPQQDDNPPLSPNISQETPDKKTSPQKEDTQVPRLDLDEKIMTRQRKISSVRRKAPAQDDEQKKNILPRSKQYILNQPNLTTAEENRLIAQIVARDIKKLCRDI
ncbi:MAG: hypothetical protein ACYSUK_06465 [Planctomycetota bacterium]|jgi:hypothetical protein